MVPFNRPVAAGNELEYLSAVLSSGDFASDGIFTRRCETFLAAQSTAASVQLTNSATTSLELAALLANLAAGDEVIMPSFTYVTCASAVALRGAVPVFVDIDPETLNLDVSLAADAITARTRAIIVVHYAGVPCDMDAFLALAERHGLVLIEDAAQAFMSRYRGRPAGSLGHFGILSFHATKNVTCGEGGALLVKRLEDVRRAGILHQKGTDRAAFLRGDVDAYRWVDLGSSFAPSEFTAAVLLAQLERAAEITAERQAQWRTYHEAFAGLDDSGAVRRPHVPTDVDHNGHIYYLLLSDTAARDAFMARMAESNVAAPFHFVPLDQSPAGRALGRPHGDLAVTDSAAGRLVRLPLWRDMGDTQHRVIEAVLDAFPRADA